MYMVVGRTRHINIAIQKSNDETRLTKKRSRRMFAINITLI